MPGSVAGNGAAEDYDVNKQSELVGVTERLHQVGDQERGFL